MKVEVVENEGSDVSTGKEFRLRKLKKSLHTCIKLTLNPKTIITTQGRLTTQSMRNRQCVKMKWIFEKNRNPKRRRPEARYKLKTPNFYQSVTCTTALWTSVPAVEAQRIDFWILRRLQRTQGWSRSGACTFAGIARDWSWFHPGNPASSYDFRTFISLP